MILKMKILKILRLIINKGVLMEKVDMLKYEKELYKEGYFAVCGCDEAGRGPLVGPVVAGAVVLPQNYYLEGLT